MADTTEGLPLRGVGSLLLGVPVTEEEFISRVPQSDWLAGFRYLIDATDTQSNLQTAWHRHYKEEVAAPLATLIRTANELGVSVIQGATLPDIARATSTTPLVIILSHWKGPDVSVDDVIEPIAKNHVSVAEAFLERLRTDNTPIANWIALRLKDSFPEASGDRELTTLGRELESAKNQRERLAVILNEAVTAAEVPEENPEECATPIIEMPITTWSKRRELLDQLFAGLIEPGNRLELFDGLHGKIAIEEVISSDFRGVLDLTTCTSAPLADFIGTKRDYCLRTVHFDCVQSPMWAATAISTTLKLFATGVAYQEARNDSINMMTRTVRKIRDNKRWLKIFGWKGD
jgi:hypothetical protein